jgi:hypothetical protein
MDSLFRNKVNGISPPPSGGEGKILFHWADIPVDLIPNDLFDCTCKSSKRHSIVHDPLVCIRKLYISKQRDIKNENTPS